MNIHTYIPICICKYTYIKDTCLNKKLMSKFIMKIFLHFFLQKSELTLVLSRILFFANIMQFGVCMCVYKYVCVYVIYFFLNKFYLFFNCGKLFYSFVLVSAIQQCEPVMIIYIPSLLQFPPLHLFHPSRSS